MKLIHFFFVEIGLGKLNNHPIYINNIKIIKEKNPKSKIIIWDENKLNNLVEKNYPELLNFWNNFPSKFYKIDFGRYLVLKLYGGMYIDLDMKCLSTLPDEDEMDFINVFVDKKGKETFNNNVIYFRNNKIYDELINFAIYRYIWNKMPKTWKKRKLLYTVGAKMFHKFCKDKKFNKTNVSRYFEDLQTKSWLKVEV